MSHAAPLVLSHLESRYARTRALTTWLAAPLEPEDMTAQSMPDCSPTKWHLGHTTWFFETFVLGASSRYRPCHPAYATLFNSYYNSVGEPWARPSRGLLTRPTCAEVARYRQHVDDAMAALLAAGAGQDTAALVEVGLHHEQQHQELILTDLKHLFGMNPLAPRYRRLPAVPGPAPEPRRWRALPGGPVATGAADDGFAFDNERPRHTRWVAPFRLASRPVTNREYAAFIADGGYRRGELWLSDGWEWARAGGIGRPLYWCEDLASHFTLGGILPLPPEAPVAHVSYYEADAFARWAGARLPREEEWELAAADVPVEGNFLESGLLQPAPAAAGAAPFAQLFGDVWEWTQSAYAPYPGFRPAPPPLTEYNGKFMSGQVVLRGGSCLSPRGHLRATYRNFMPPGARWQVSGIRLAADP